MTNELNTPKGAVPSKKKAKRRNLVSGSCSDEFTNVIINQTLNTIWYAHNDEKAQTMQIDSSIAALRGIAPQDEIEGMIAAQMIATHNASMECFKRAMIKEQGFESRNCNLKHATKLTRCYTDMMMALNKYRGKGQQKVTVKHVNVSDGGQAIVGNVEKEK